MTSISSLQPINLSADLRQIMAARSAKGDHGLELKAVHTANSAGAPEFPAGMPTLPAARQSPSAAQMIAQADDPSATAAMLDGTGGEARGRTYDAHRNRLLEAGASSDVIAGLDRNRAQFLDIADRAAAAGGDAKDFISRLSPAERSVLQEVHRLADRIDAAGLTEEGAANLLQAPGYGVDTNGDGFTMVGKATTMQFPPGDAPEAVRSAFDDATAGMRGSDRAMLQMHMWSAGNGGIPIDPTAVQGQSGSKAQDMDYAELARQAINQILAGLPQQTSQHGRDSAEARIDALLRFRANLA
jgi:hypothetical protein